MAWVFWVFLFGLCLLSFRIETSQGQESIILYLFSARQREGSLSFAHNRLLTPADRQVITIKINHLYAYIQVASGKLRRAEILCFIFVTFRVPIMPHMAHGRNIFPDVEWEPQGTKATVLESYWSYPHTLGGEHAIAHHPETMQPRALHWGPVQGSRP